MTDHSLPEINNAASWQRRFWILGALGLVVYLTGLWTDPEQFWASGLLNTVFWITLGLGGLFFVLIHHIAGSVWSVNIRRQAEAVMVGLPWMLLFALPLLVWGVPHLFEWASPDAVAAHPVLREKAGYLNPSAFRFRSGVYFVLWIVLCGLLYRVSLRQDREPHPDLIRRMRIISAPGIFVFALTLTFFGFDWVMSLDPLWYSTIFGVYIFSGSYLVILAFLILLNLALRSGPAWGDVVTVEHYHDLGKLLFAFTVFWGYIGGSQYFFIWYTNIPEETVWYLHRWEHGWKWVTLLLIVGHFVIPFLTLIFRASKRNLRVLLVMALWMIAMQWVDLYWLIVPTFHPHAPHLSWMDGAAFLGIGGIFLGIFWRTFTTHPLVPVGDPKLKDSIEFTNS
ncbi:MAG: hypothetical protein D6762_05810 [Candidatus Neomarinimicrobiota bacterium]|nr:MAG: hypothetical protein D6762_05810 [Candidatus Neomarinimicrobiota bacterium]